jgi:sensor histidine kinase YesM
MPRNKYIFLILSLWVLLTSIHLLVLSYILHIESPTALFDSVLGNTSFMAFGIGLWFQIKGMPSQKKDRNKLVVNHLITGLALVGLWLVVNYYVLSTLYESDTDYVSLLKQSLGIRAIYGLLLYTMLSLAMHLIHAFQQQKEHENREAELQRIVKESELNLLKSQINPHFLFNSLNSIAALTLSNQQKAHEMIIELSDFMRFTIRNNEQEMHTLQSEIANIRRYLTIEKIRFGERLQTKENLDEGCMNCQIPNMMLQPLFENAIKHGVTESTTPIIISFDCKIDGNMLTVGISNNYQSGVTSVKGKGFGLKNIQRRLEILYRRNDLLKISKTSDTFHVDLFIPQNIIN